MIKPENTEERSYLTNFGKEFDMENYGWNKDNLREGRKEKIQWLGLQNWYW